MLASTVIITLVVGVFVLTRALRAPKPSSRKPDKYLRPREWKDQDVTIGWIGHSTVLMNIYGYRIMTDPILGEKIGVAFGNYFQIGMKRYIAPAVNLDELGYVDLILLSHAHFDHFDLPSLRKLTSERTRVITAKNTAHLLKGLPFSQVDEMAGEEQIMIDDLKITAVPVVHWGNRFYWNYTYGVTGYLIERKGIKIFFPGDTAYTAMKRLTKWGKIDIVCMPIGAYSPTVYQKFHCTPEQAWKMFIHTGAKWMVPIHWNTFILSKEPQLEPMERLIRVAQGETDRIVIQQQGEYFTIPEKENKETETDF